MIGRKERLGPAEAAIRQAHDPNAKKFRDDVRARIGGATYFSAISAVSSPSKR
jgi:hypothetical protein